MVNKSLKGSMWVQSQEWQNDLCLFQRQTIQHHSNPSLCLNHWCLRSWTFLWRPTRPSRINTKKKKERERERDVLFIIEDWNEKVGSQEIPRVGGVTGKFGLRIQNEAGQRLTEFCQENAQVTVNTLFQQHETTLHTDITRCSIPKSDWLYSLQPKMEKLYIVSKTRLGADYDSDHELLIAKLRLKLKKVGKIIRPFKYDLNLISYSYSLEVTNRFKGLDLIEYWRTKDRI